MERQQGIPDLCYLGAASDSTANADAGVLDNLFTARTLKECLDRYGVFLPRYNGRKAELRINGRSATLNISTPVSEPDAPNQRFSDWSNVFIAVLLMRKALGQFWCPDAISLQARAMIGDHVRVEFPDTHFVTSANETSLQFPTRLLTTRMPAWRILNKYVPGGIGAFQSVSTLPDALRAILRPYLAYEYLGIDLAAEAAGMSVRSLQRALGAHGLTYSELIERERIEQAEKLLEDSGLRITDIAFDLGYRNATHFSRAFRRKTGMSPRKYRRGQFAEAVELGASRLTL